METQRGEEILHKVTELVSGRAMVFIQSPTGGERWRSGEEEEPLDGGTGQKAEMKNFC